jgi:hypothetical protein
MVFENFQVTHRVECQGGGGTNAAAPRGDRGAVNPEHFSSYHQQYSSRALFNTKC